ncbi:DUF302 domain-containing protein [Xanthobacter oligotrophicus]|uniref:DUF302 domain-containing protein n=1 Tax=Xanthobacter oligotrophicus TaxID=2607286 RepID=A0ABW6ZYJ0_9HYPH
MTIRTLAWGILLAATTSVWSPPAHADAVEPKVAATSIKVEHVRIESAKPYAEVRAALEKLVPRFDDRIRVLLQYGEIGRVKVELEKVQGSAGLVIFSVAPHGDWVQILGQKQNAAQFVTGNVLIATQMTSRNAAAGLYAPLRIMLYETAAGTAVLKYDRPSDLFGQYGNREVTEIAGSLDRKIFDVLVTAAH